MKSTLIFALAALTAACETTQRDTYAIWIDSIAVPDTVGAQQNLPVRLWGVIGPDGCHSFHHFEDAKTPTTLNLLAVGVRVRSSGVACTQAVVPLDTTYIARPPHQDSLVITVFRPNATAISKVVDVR